MVPVKMNETQRNIKWNTLVTEWGGRESEFFFKPMHCCIWSFWSEDCCCWTASLFWIFSTLQDSGEGRWWQIPSPAWLSQFQSRISLQSSVAAGQLVFWWIWVARCLFPASRSLPPVLIFAPVPIEERTNYHFEKFKDLLFVSRH